MPLHTVPAPVIVIGAGLTVTAVVALQPAAEVKVIIATPVSTPVTRPVDDTTVATPVLPLTQVPPVLPDSVVVLPLHKVPAPLITGVGFTVIAAVR